MSDHRGVVQAPGATELVWEFSRSAAGLLEQGSKELFRPKSEVISSARPPGLLGHDLSFVELSVEARKVLEAIAPMVPAAGPVKSPDDENVTQKEMKFCFSLRNFG